MKFVDTNVFLRVITGDDPIKARRCRAFFQRVQHAEERATTSEAIIAEVLFVLAQQENVRHGACRDR